MKEFTCEMCGGTFEAGWSDQDAYAECQEVFGCTPNTEDCAVVCDDCYSRMVPYRYEIEPQTVEQHEFIQKHKGWVEQQLRGEWYRQYKEYEKQIINRLLYGETCGFEPIGICAAEQEETVDPFWPIPSNIKKSACEDMLNEYIESLDWRANHATANRKAVGDVPGALPMDGDRDWYHLHVCRQ